MESVFSIPVVLGDTIRIARNNWRLALLALLCCSVPMVAIDLVLDETSATQAGSIWGLVTLLIQIVVTHRLLASANALENADAGRAFYPRAFGQGFVAGIAIIIGLVLFIVPGLVLAVRWSLSLVVLIATDGAIVDSLGQSWELTRGHALRVFAAFAIATVPALCGIAVSMLVDTGGLAAGDFLTSVTQILWWFAAVAIFLRLREIPERT